MRVRSEAKDIWDTNLKALYQTDLEVDNAKARRCSHESPKEKKGKGSLPLMESSEQLTNEEVKEILSQHIPQGPRKIFQTPPLQHVEVAKGTLPPVDLALPPPVPMSSPQMSRFSTEKGKRVPSFTTLSAKRAGTRLPLAWPFRSAAATRMVRTSGCFLSQSFIGHLIIWGRSFSRTLALLGRWRLSRVLIAPKTRITARVTRII